MCLASLILLASPCLNFSHFQYSYVLSTTGLSSASPRLTSPSLGMGLESRHISEVLCSGTRKLQSWDAGRRRARGGATCTVMLGKKAGSPRLNTDTSNTGFFSLPITSLDLFGGGSLVCATRWQVVFRHGLVKSFFLQFAHKRWPRT